MTQFLDALTSPWAFLLTLVVFGFAPKFVLRLIVLAFHPDDPRRHELLGEIHAVPRLERPLWVFEQLEVALVEGLGERLLWAATGRIIWRWRLDDAVQRNGRYPASFHIPNAHAISAVRPGWTVKLLFKLPRDGFEERMWVEVAKVKRRGFVGHLSNTPVGIPRLEPGRRIRFRAHHIADVWPDDRTIAAMKRAGIVDDDGEVIDVHEVHDTDTDA